MPDAPQVTVPKVGKVKRSYVLVIGAGITAYVGWRWYAARGAGGETTYTTDYVGETIPTGGAGSAGGSGNVQYGGTPTDATSADVIDTNAEWTNRAVELLSNAGNDPAAVYAALGDYLSGSPLTTAEQSLVRAALAAVGNPPVGGPYVIKEQVGTVSLTAPTGLKVTATAATSVNLSWSTVTGAAGYYIYRSDMGTNTINASGSSATVYGLVPNTAYSFQVAAYATTGKAGPKSTSVNTKTTGAKLTAPATPSASQVSRDRAYLTTRPITGATTYIWYINGAIKGRTEGPALWVSGLRANTSYKASVKADAHPQAPGPMSGTLTFRTKK